MKFLKTQAFRWIWRRTASQCVAQLASRRSTSKEPRVCRTRTRKVFDVKERMKRQEDNRTRWSRRNLESCTHWRIIGCARKPSWSFLVDPNQARLRKPSWNRSTAKDASLHDATTLFQGMFTLLSRFLVLLFLAGPVKLLKAFVHARRFTGSSPNRGWKWPNKNKAKAVGGDTLAKLAFECRTWQLKLLEGSDCGRGCCPRASSGGTESHCGDAWNRWQ